MLGVDRLVALTAAGARIVADLDPDRILDEALAAGREATGARYAAIGILDGSRRALARFETSGIDEATHRNIGDLPQGHGILGLLIREPRPLRLTSIGTHARSYGFPVGHPTMTTFLGVPIESRGEVWGNFYLTDKDSGEPFDEADEAAIILLARWIAAAVANADAYRRESDRRAELERSIGALEATSAVARAISDETDLDRILELVVKRGRALLDARAAAVLLLEAEELVVARVAGALAEDVVGRRADALDSLCGEALVAGAPTRLGRIGDRSRLAPLEGLDAHALLCVPLYVRGRALGVLVALDRLEGGPEFSDEDERIFAAFAASGATAMATARNAASESLHRAIEASERERARWARELHDEPLQELAALKLALGRVRRARDDAERDAALAVAVEQTDRAVRGLRDVVTDLRPAALDEQGPAPALRALAARVGAQNGLEIRLDVDALAATAARYAVEVESTIYRVVQEALTNVVKHARAHVATVTVTKDDRAIRVAVRDDGIGMSGDVPEGSFGLIGMRERIALVGGALDISSHAGRGTSIDALIPIDGAGAARRGMP